LECFFAFTQDKKEIILDLFELNDSRADVNINNLLIHSLKERHPSKRIKRKDDDLTNVVHSDIFSISVSYLSCSFCFSFYMFSFHFSLPFFSWKRSRVT